MRSKRRRTCFPESAPWRNLPLELRSPSVAPDREALARALYILDRAPDSSYEKHVARLWDEEPEHIKATVRLWLEEADRLLRILGGFPVATEPWESLALTAELCSSLEMDVRQLRDALYTLLRIAEEDLPCEYGGDGTDEYHCERCGSIVNGRAALAATSPDGPRPSTVATPQEDQSSGPLAP